MELWEGQMTDVPTSDSISTKQSRIAELAKQMPDVALHSLSQHIDQGWLREAHRRTRKDGAPGIDQQTSQDYATALEANLGELENRAKSGLYRAPPVRRVFIPKGKGKQRPIGIPTFEDKVLQRAVQMVLEPLYEQDFYACSYGFRPGRSAHQALEAVNQWLYSHRGGWVLDVDVQSFFDSLDHQKLKELLSQRVADGVLVRLIGKWLRAGVLEGGVVRRTDRGTPQGGVISPLLANIYLHEVLDVWWHRDVLPRLRGSASMVRYADDFVLLFSDEGDARRVQSVLPQRFGRFGLTLHPEKTRLVSLKRGGDEGDGGGRASRSFDFLGFTHYMGESRRGYWVPKRHTAKDRMSRALRTMNQWLRRVRHHPVGWQAAMLRRKLQGYFAYYAIAGNAHRVRAFRVTVVRLWHKWLSRRSQRATIMWDDFQGLLARHPLPIPRLRTSWGKLTSPAKP